MIYLVGFLSHKNLGKNPEHIFKKNANVKFSNSIIP